MSMTRKAWASDSTGSLVNNNHFNGVSPLGGLISSASTALSVIFPCFSVMRPLRRLRLALRAGRFLRLPRLSTTPFAGMLI